MNLYHILRRFDSRIQDVNSLLVYAISIEHSEHILFQALSAYIIISLQNIWASCCRQLVVYSSYGGYTTLTGLILPRAASFSGFSDPVDWLRYNWSRSKKMNRSWEPDWHIPTQCSRAAQLLCIPNYTTVLNALSAITIVEQLRLTRNAIAHSLPVTYSRFRNLSTFMGFSRNISPEDIIYLRIGNTGPLIFDHWISEMRLCIAAAIR
jgi:hypothetical protein